MHTTVGKPLIEIRTAFFCFQCFQDSVPWHKKQCFRNDFAREEYVGARDTAFLLIIKSKKEEHEFDIHYSLVQSNQSVFA